MGRKCCSGWGLQLPRLQQGFWAMPSSGCPHTLIRYMDYALWPSSPVITSISQISSFLQLLFHISFQELGEVETATAATATTGRGKQACITPTSAASTLHLEEPLNSPEQNHTAVSLEMIPNIFQKLYAIKSRQYMPRLIVRDCQPSTLEAHNLVCDLSNFPSYHLDLTLIDKH